MKRIKKNWLVILIFFLVMIPIFRYSFTFVENQKNVNAMRQETILYCQNEMNEENEEFCTEVLESQHDQIDFYTMMTDMLIFGIRFINPIAFLLLIFPTLVNICKILKRKYIINALTRQSYKDFLNDFFKVAYKYIWLLPLIAIVIFIVCIANTTFDISFSLKYENAMWYTETIENRFLFIMGYLFNILIYSFSFINLALIVARKHHNVVSAVILSVLSYVGIELFFELVINNLIFVKIFHSELGYLFNIMNVFTFSDQFGTAVLLLFSISMFLLSCFGVYLAYRNKEKLVIDCEKNQ